LEIRRKTGQKGGEKCKKIVRSYGRSEARIEMWEGKNAYRISVEHLKESDYLQDRVRDGRI
jgi:hypothetical protein